MKSLRCHLFGHLVDEDSQRFWPHFPFCERCGEPEISPDGQSIWDERDRYGILGVPYYRLRKVLAIWFPRCWECRKLIVFRPVEAHFCSQRCAKDWIPF